MTITPGTRIGSYEVLAKLGEGGMGEVYRARDTKLDRDVAIKVLPESFAADADRVARFTREAKVLASLNHPNIAGIYGIEEFREKTSGVFSGGAAAEKTPDVFSRALVMELVEGQDLSEMIRSSEAGRFSEAGPSGPANTPGLKTRPPYGGARPPYGGARPPYGGIPLADAIAIARQIADALEAAHEQGIVHRDLKPQNIKVREDGTVKVLDFGLAKAVDRTLDSGPWTQDPANSPTLTARATQVGVILGTAAYMSPEQAKGKPVDKRADIWAYGVVLYEMLTGRRAFEGEDISTTLAAVLMREPDFTALPADTPPAVANLVRRCLERDPKQRLRDIGEARLLLSNPQTMSASPVAASTGPVVAKPLFTVSTIAAALALAIVTGIAAWWLKPAPAVTNVPAKFEFTLPEGVEFTRTGRQNLAISPDGTMIAFTANDQIYIRRMGELEAKPVRGSNVDPLDLAFSPDSQSIAFFAPAVVRGETASGGGIKKIGVTGGAPVSLCAATSPYGLSWSGDRIVFSIGTSIQSVAETGGTPTTLVEVAKDSGELVSRPQIVNGGRDLIYSVRPSGVQFGDGQVVTQPIGGGARRVLVQGGTDGRLVSSGHLLWVQENTLFAQPATAAVQLSGGAVPVLENLQFTATTGNGKFGVADNGSITFLEGPSNDLSDLYWVDRQGHEDKLGTPPHTYAYPRLSPDGTRVAVGAFDGVRDIWIWDLARKALSRLTSGPEDESIPIWTPDSRRVIYRVDPGGQSDLFRRMADGTGTAERLTNTPDTDVPLSVLPDGRVLEHSGQTAPFTFLLTPGSNAAPTRVIPGVPIGHYHAAVSPDGRWIVYQSAEGSTIDEIHVRPFPNTDAGHWQISVAGGRAPSWSRDGRELFFLDRAQRGLMVVPVQTSPGRSDFAYGAPRQLLDATKWRSSNSGRGYDVSPDGRRFLVVMSIDATATANQKITVITNWLDELRVKVGVKK